MTSKTALDYRMKFFFAALRLGVSEFEVRPNEKGETENDIWKMFLSFSSDQVVNLR